MNSRNEASKRILITGSAGFVGTHLVEHLIANTNWEIIGIDSFRHRGDSLRIFQDPNRYKIFTHDLTTPISERLIRAIGHIDYIVNMASESHVDRSITDPVAFVENNVKLTLNILEYARNISPSVFVQVSTDEVYGPALEGVNHAEWSVILPSNPYAASKASQEAIAISYWRTYGVPLIITNTMNMIGERQDKEKFIPMSISNIEQGNIVTVHGSEEYIGKRFYLHARNMSDAILFLIKKTKVTKYYDSLEQVVMPDRYNIVGDVEMDNLQIVQFIAKLMNRELKFKFEDFHLTRPGHDRRYALDGSKIKNLGWVAPISFEESLQRTIQWTLKNREWL